MSSFNSIFASSAMQITSYRPRGRATDVFNILPHRLFYKDILDAGLLLGISADFVVMERRIQNTVRGKYVWRTT